MGSVSNIGAVQDLYQSCADQFGAAFARLAAGYEADPDLRRDLVQEIHVALWLSLRRFDARCSLRTWAFRVAHNTAASYVARQMKYRSGAWVNLYDAQYLSDPLQTEAAANKRIVLDQVLALVHNLIPIDRQIMLLYLEGFECEEIAVIAGVSPSNVTTKIHRIKGLLAQQLQEGKSNARNEHGRNNTRGVEIATDEFGSLRAKPVA